MPPQTVPLAPLRRRDIQRSTDCRHTTNAAAVLRAALDHGPVARSSIARLAGLSPAAVSRLCADLTAAGLLRDLPAAPGSGAVGRPHIPVDVDTSRLLVCGMHLGADAATLSLLDLRGTVIARARAGYPDSSAARCTPRQVLEHVAGQLPGFLDEHAAGRTPLGLGVASGGWVDPEAGILRHHPVLRWWEVPVRAILAAATGLAVRVDNHSRALARAEQLFGDVRARESVVHLFVGNVVDAAFATGDTVHQGPGSAAGAVAHLPVPGRAELCGCGRSGCLQAVVASHVLARRAAAAGITGTMAFGALLDAARSGDRRAVGMLTERARMIARAGVLLLDMLNPGLLVITEAGTANLPECLAAFRAELAASSALARGPGGKATGQPVTEPGFAAEPAAVAGGAVILNEVYASPLRGRPAMSRAS